MCPQLALLLALGVLMFHTSSTESREYNDDGWYERARLIIPAPLYPSSGKRHLPYHPVARSKGADSKTYAHYPINYPEVMNQPPPGNKEDRLISAGELLTLLAHAPGLRTNDGSRILGTMRFGIARR